MSMAKIKLKQLVQHGDLLDRYGARIRILGQRELIKPDVLEAVDRAVEMTSRNEGNCVLNVCFPYTSREEITTAIKDVVEEWSKPMPQDLEQEKKSPFQQQRIQDTIRNQQHDHPDTNHLSPPTGLTSPSSSTTSLSSYSHSPSDQETSSSVSTSTTLHDPTSTPPLTHPSKRAYPSPESITSTTLTSHMYTAPDPPVDLLIRTSGVSRLSDFMLWQCHETTEIVFLDVLWPEFDLWSFLPVIWEWQWRRRREEKLLGEGEKEERGKTGTRRRKESAKVS
jgi:ditrans,polycis-polyprenyl diphosphate synthase